MDYETKDINSILRTVRINTVIVKFVTRYNVHLLEFELLVQHTNNAKCYKPGGQQCYMHSHSTERIGKRIYLPSWSSSQVVSSRRGGGRGGSERGFHSTLFPIKWIGIMDIFAGYCLSKKLKNILKKDKK